MGNQGGSTQVPRNRLVAVDAPRFRDRREFEGALAALLREFCGWETESRFAAALAPLALKALTAADPALQQRIAAELAEEGVAFAELRALALKARALLAAEPKAE